MSRIIVIVIMFGKLKEMTKLHELLAASKTVSDSWNTTYADALTKLGKPITFEGESVTLKMLEESESNKAIEAAASTYRPLKTSVVATLDYALGFFAKYEDHLLAKHETNAKAKADLQLDGVVIATGLTSNYLIELGKRLGKLRELALAAPTLDAGKPWTYDSGQGQWAAAPEITTKTEKIMVPVILSPATDKHPAQVKESTKDNTIGKFTRVKRCTALTALQKAGLITLIDKLILEAEMARQRANDTVVVTGQVGGNLVRIIQEQLEKDLKKSTAESTSA